MAEEELSKYQSAIIAFQEDEDGGHGIGQAYAGAGKSFILKKSVMAHDDEENVFVGAFNASIAKALSQSIRRANLDISTIHSLGGKTLRRSWHKDARINDDVDVLGRYIDDCLGKNPPAEAPGDVRKLVEKCMAFVADDADEDKAWAQVEELMYRYECAPSEPEVVSPDKYVDWALAVLKKLREPSPFICYGQMLYVPAYYRMKTGWYRHVFIDEMQDMNRAQHRLALQALHEQGRFFGVGDRWQCHPPGVLIQTSRAGEASTIESLAGTVTSWNRNAQKMCDGRRFAVSSRPYSGDMLTVEVNDRSVPMTPNHKVLARWTDTAHDVCVTYLMYRDGFGFRVGWCKLFSVAREEGGKKTFHLGHRARIEKADAVWVLKAHSNRTQASVYESVVAAKYGLPTATFEPVNGANHLTEAAIRVIFDALGDENRTRGYRALREHGRHHELPLYPWPACQGEEPAAYRRSTYFAVHAVNVEPGLMALPLPDGQNTWAEVTGKSKEHYDGPVYSLDVEKDHSYAANGVVVLNSIYAWNGAAPGGMDKMKKALKAKEFKLPISYRAPEAVARFVRETYIPDFEARPGAPEGLVKAVDVAFMRKHWAPGDMYISRKNAPLPKACLMALADGIPAYIKGGRDITKGLFGLIRKSRQTGTADFLKWLGSHVERQLVLLGAAKQEKAIEDLVDTKATLVALAEGTDSVRQIENRLNKLFGDESPEEKLMCTTAFKAKGLETEPGRAVWLDWPSFRDNNEEERNIRYVAETRTQDKLYLVGSKGK